MAPNDANVLHATGFCLSRLGRSIEALIVFDAALAARPGFAPSLHHKGTVLESLGDELLATGHYDLAIASEPRYADPLAGRASVAARQGKFAEARDFAHRALDIEPRQSIAHMALAAADIGESRFDPAAARLKTLLADPTFNAADRPAALALLGDTMDARDQCEAALGAYVEGKQESREQYAATPIAKAARVHLDRLAELTLYARTLDPWAATAPDLDPVGPSDPSVHVFLVGFPRSGTTLLEQVLASHSEIITLDEKPLLEQAESEFLISASHFQRLIDISDDALEPYRTLYWWQIADRGLRVSGKVFVDKFPLNSLLLPLIARLFPRAKILFSERDPRDVVFSCFRRCFAMNPAMYQFVTLQGAATFYDKVMSLVKEYRRIIPNTLYVARYESLIEDFERECRQICAFLGVEWNESMGDFAATASGRSIATPSAVQVRRGLYSEGVGQWRRYREALEPVLPILSPWIESLSYPAN